MIGLVCYFGLSESYFAALVCVRILRFRIELVVAFVDGYAS